jgi:hypothetical protein
MRTFPLAIASRADASFAVTSTIVAFPFSSMWEKTVIATPYHDCKKCMRKLAQPFSLSQEGKEILFQKNPLP